MFHRPFARHLSLFLTLGLGLVLSGPNSGCADGSPIEVPVSIKTDLLPGIEFIRAEISRMPDLSRLSSPRETLGYEGSRDDRFVQGELIGVFSVQAGPLVLRARLIAPDGSTLAEQWLMAQVDAERSVTVFITRNCAGVECGDGAAAEACLGGNCVDARCTADRSFCGSVAICQDDFACADGAGGCSRGICAQGVCLQSPTECGEGRYCSAELGCVADDCACPPRPGSDVTCTLGTCGYNCAPGFQDCDGEPTNGCEADLASTDHCGTCNARCEFAGASAACVGMQCVLAMCEPTSASCDGDELTGCETDITSPADCGACGVSCGSDASCSSGACVIGECPDGVGDCDGDPTNGCETPLMDGLNCGACGVACAVAGGTGSCGTGTCVASACNDGLGDCDGNAANGCESPTDTPSNCGDCGQSCDAILNAVTTCSAGTCDFDACLPGFDDCDGERSNGCETPIDTLSNCGSCGDLCDGLSCPLGMCSMCPSGMGDCDGNTGNGCETPLDTLTNCGGCSVPCTVASGTASCRSGSCVVASCDAARADCDGDPTNGCETATDTLSDCGACDAVCALANASETCTSGTCRVLACEAGWGNCNGDATDGCETRLNTLNDCGSCGEACSIPGAAETCGRGSCQIASCNGGRADCNRNPSDGCETSLGTTSDCGACEDMCDASNATASCVAGSCGIGACDPGFEDCDSDPGTGCETDITTTSDCGTCGFTCSPLNASPTCNAGSCGFSMCDVGFVNCDGSAANGCETPLGTTDNCASCGDVCMGVGGTPVCNAGTCEISSCMAGLGDCDGDSANGCETPLTTASDCGGCAVPCSPPNAIGMCGSGTCEVGSCDVGFADCDGVAANGCEVDTRTDVDHCGGCDVDCSPPNGTGMCSASTCLIASCNAGWTHCDASTVNGCETELGTNNNCGQCGETCEWSECTGTSCEPITSMGSGWRHTCVLAGDEVYCWGSNASGEIGNGVGGPGIMLASTPSNPVSGASQMSGTQRENCAVLNGGGGVRCFGRNFHGQNGDGTQDANFSAVSVVGLSGQEQVWVGAFNACARRAGGFVQCWGINLSGEHGDGTMDTHLTPMTEVNGRFQDLAMGSGYVCGSKSDGVYCWGDEFTGPSATPTLRLASASVVDMATGFKTACAIASGRVQCWGSNMAGQLGNGSTTDSAAPVDVMNLTAAVDLSGANSTFCAVERLGTVKCWGNNNQGQLGDGTTTNRTVPVEVSLPTGANHVEVSGLHACASTNDGRLFCWGNNTWGQLGDGTSTRRLTPVEVDGPGPF